MSMKAVQLDQLLFPDNLSRKKSQFKLVVQVTYWDQKMDPKAVTGIAPDLFGSTNRSYWECDASAADNLKVPNQFALDIDRIEDRTIAIVNAARIESIGVGLYDADRQDWWEIAEVREFLALAAGSQPVKDIIAPLPGATLVLAGLLSAFGSVARLNERLLFTKRFNVGSMDLAIPITLQGRGLDGGGGSYQVQLAFIERMPRGGGSGGPAPQ